MVAETLGARSIIASDMVASRRAKALEFGAHLAFDAEGLAGQVHAATHGEGADVVIVGPGSIAAMDAAVACVARGGTILLFTPLPPDTPWPMPVNDLYFRDVSVVTSYSAGPDETREALRLLENGMPVKRLITHRFDLDEVREAYRLVAAAGEALKVIVYPDRS
jgi:L-iditol 2-dehydrogenase